MLGISLTNRKTNEITDAHAGIVEWKSGAYKRPQGRFQTRCTKNKKRLASCDWTKQHTAEDIEEWKKSTKHH